MCNTCHQTPCDKECPTKLMDKQQKKLYKEIEKLLKPLGCELSLECDEGGSFNLCISDKGNNFPAVLEDDM